MHLPMFFISNWEFAESVLVGCFNLSKLVLCWKFSSMAIHHTQEFPVCIRTRRPPWHVVAARAWSLCETEPHSVHRARQSSAKIRRQNGRWPNGH
jgi:hypothetical protein